MNTPFRLDEHRRRPQPPLAPPPDRYFEQLPMRVMQRVPAAPAPAAPAWGWLAALSAPLRTALASVVVLGGFAASFLLNPAGPAGPVAGAALARVPQQELMQYLLASDQRISLTDLAELPGTARSTPAETYLHASPDELQDLLDLQPSEETYL
ncbi:hypothetical protein [Hymenobacter rubripertinctus]|uniref:Uncharacterized protein n=1 Tax=Hymenobacter rubripertinctus TaxID=2029981 RepID=A0A418R7J1_9BACT|nr:hypothetical protein [Hymenobacter rubripertinctus]RIY13285.1 hypothetical protein D0T11_02290 [Hymenobacter rubripertinctus]